MNDTKIMSGILSGIAVFLLLVVTICGVCSFNTVNSYEAVNQYGSSIKMWGSGIYAHDSYFKAPIFIGSDFTILIFVIPMAALSFIKAGKTPSIEHCIRIFGVWSLLLYYSSSLAFGVTYNNLHLIYIALFGVSFFGTVFVLAKLHTASMQNGNSFPYLATKGMKVFLIISGIALFTAWLPDIVTSIVKGTSLELIEVYTTEITYVLDMGIISPLIFITYFLAKRKSFMGYVLIRMIFKICAVVGIMLPIQTIFQMMAGIIIPVPALVTKVFSFMMLAVFAVFFEHQLKCRIKKEYAEELE